MNELLSSKNKQLKNSVKKEIAKLSLPKIKAEITKVKVKFKELTEAAVLCVLIFSTYLETLPRMIAGNIIALTQDKKIQE